MTLKNFRKFKSYLLYGVAFGLVVALSSFFGGVFHSKNAPTVSKGVQLPSIVPSASADDAAADAGDACDSDPGGGDISCE